jgi:hypothetical protein
VVVVDQQLLVLAEAQGVLEQQLNLQLSQTQLI